MAGVGRRGLRLHVTVAFTLVLSAWVSRSTCSSLHRLGENPQHTGVDEATAAGEERGKILFDGKDLELQVEPSSAAASGKLLKIILGQSSRSGDLEKKDSTDKEAAWRHLKPSLHCGQSKMELRATGHDAADLQLDLGAAAPLPLDQVPKTCGYTMRKMAPGFVLAVFYDGCNMIQENGNYVLKMRWLDVSVEFICSVKSSPKYPDPYASHASQEPKPLPVSAWAPNRHRRHAPGPLYYDPRSLYNYYACLYHYYNTYMMNPGHPCNAVVPTATASPPRDDQQMHYNPYYHQVGNPPVMSPQSSACGSNSGKCPQHPTEKPKVPYYPPPRPPHPGKPCKTVVPTATASPPRDDQQMHYNPYYHQVGNPPVMSPQSSACGSNSGKCPQHPTEKPKVPYYPPPRPPHHPGKCPNNPLPSTTQKPCLPSTTAAPTTIAPTPCPNQDRPIGPSCRAVRKYVPFQELNFQPYISYEAGQPAKDQQQTSGAHPRGLQPSGGDERYGIRYLPDMIPYFFNKPMAYQASWDYYVNFPNYLPTGYVPEGR